MTHNHDALKADLKHSNDPFKQDGVHLQSINYNKHKAGVGTRLIDNNDVNALSMDDMRNILAGPVYDLLTSNFVS